MNNVATARGLMTILARLAERSVVSEAASDEMLEILRGQKFHEGIPAGLPPGTPVAHKTGSFRGVYHDIARGRAARPEAVRPGRPDPRDRGRGRGPQAGRRDRPRGVRESRARTAGDSSGVYNREGCRTIRPLDPLDRSHEMSTTTPAASAYDAILIVGFGGPEGREDVIPFLENVLRGRPVPRERMLEVAEHYYHFDGVSPINGQVRDLIAALEPELEAHGVDLPVYWGNRNWHPMLTDTVRADGRGRGQAGPRAWSCRPTARIRAAASTARTSSRPARRSAPRRPAIDKMRVFYNHPDFVEVNARRVREALEQFPSDRRGSAVVAFTAHSIPDSMAANCDYEEQLKETCRLVAEASGVGPDRWSLVYQSRSGRPTDPWLGPDILEHLDDLKDRGVRDVVVQPVGFLSDHMEVMFDLDEEATHRRRGAGPEHGPGRDRRDRPEVRGDAPRADPGADRPEPRAAGHRPVPGQPRRLPGRLLPAPAPAGPPGELIVPSRPGPAYTRDRPARIRPHHVGGPRHDAEAPRGRAPGRLDLLDGVRRPREGGQGRPPPSRNPS